METWTQPHADTRILTCMKRCSTDESSSIELSSMDPMGLATSDANPTGKVMLCDVDELRRRRLGASRGLVGLIGPAALPARGAPHACTALGEYCDGSGSVDTAVSEPTSGAGLLPLPAMS